MFYIRLNTDIGFPICTVGLLYTLNSVGGALTLSDRFSWAFPECSGRSADLRSLRIGEKWF